MTDFIVTSGELASSLATGLADSKMEILTFWSHDADGLSNRIPIADAMWTSSRLIITLANGQEFEGEFKPSTQTMRSERDALEIRESKAKVSDRRNITVDGGPQ